jgi:hypothetical protein
VVALSVTVSAVGPSLHAAGAAYASNYAVVQTWCVSTPLYTDSALTVPATYAPKFGEQFYFLGATDTYVKVEGPVRIPAVPTEVYYTKVGCWQLVGLHI